MPIDGDTLEQKIKALGPDTPGEKFDEIVAGVMPPPQNAVCSMLYAVIDVKRISEALKNMPGPSTC